jgi:hypothetical protein
VDLTNEEVRVLRTQVFRRHEMESRIAVCRDFFVGYRGLTAEMIDYTPDTFADFVRVAGHTKRTLPKPAPMPTRRRSRITSSSNRR